MSLLPFLRVHGIDALLLFADHVERGCLKRRISRVVGLEANDQVGIESFNSYQSRPV